MKHLDDSRQAGPARGVRRAGAPTAKATSTPDPTDSAALRESVARLGHSLEREAVLPTLLDCLRRLVPCDRGTVMLAGERQRFSLRAVFDGEHVVALPADAQSAFDPRDHGRLSETLAARAGVVVATGWMGGVLGSRRAPAGVFILERNGPPGFGADDARIAETLAVHAALAVDNALLHEQALAAKQRLQTVSRRLVEAQERERRHIARELHDEASQALASLRFGLRQLETDAGEGGDVPARVAELLRTTDAVIDGLHRLAADLRPASLDHVGLDAALRQYARSTATTYGLAVRFKARGFAGERFPAVVETALFRVVQEAVANVVRHTRATRVDVLLELLGDRVLAVVEDDGIGFDPEAVQEGQRFGLLGVRERAEALGGSLTVESTPGAGTTVVVEVATADPRPDR